MIILKKCFAIVTILYGYVDFFFLQDEPTVRDPCSGRGAQTQETWTKTAQVELTK